MGHMGHWPTSLDHRLRAPRIGLSSPAGTGVPGHYFPNWEHTPLGRNKIPRWDYHGKTIGPVPTPDEGTSRGEWVDQLVAWHREARKWGWYDKGGEELWETRAAELKADPTDQRIRGLLAKVKEDHEAGRLLEETYALWRYNLEYLLKMP